MVRITSLVACSLGLVTVGCSSPSTTTASGSATASASASASASQASNATASASGDASASANVSSAALGKLTVGTDSLFQDEGAVVEGFDEGSAAFVVAPDGAVKVAVADASGKPVSDRTAKLTYTIPETGATTEVPLHADADKHYLVANGPELSSTVVTPVKYEITGGPRPWTGFLQLPQGGTKALNASAQLAATAHATPIVGPHGGRIERIGKDDVELLMDKDSGETRAWIIVDGKAVEPGDRKFAVLIDDKRVELKADANASFYAKVSVDMGISLGAIHKVSGELTVGTATTTILFGLRPHVYVYAPRVVIDVDVDNWTKEKKAKWDTHPDDDDHDHGKHEGHDGDDDHGDHGDKGKHEGHDADHGGGDSGHGHDQDHGHGDANGNHGAPPGNGDHGGDHGGDKGKSHGGGHGH